MSQRISLAAALALGGCAPMMDTPPTQFDHPFIGRLIVEQEAPDAVAHDPRCLKAWDIKQGATVYACSWRFEDSLNPGQIACHQILPNAGGEWMKDNWAWEIALIDTETANCNGWHDNRCGGCQWKSYSFF
jgi:hypothetical protein